MFKFGNLSRQTFTRSTSVDPDRDNTAFLLKGTTENNWPSDDRRDMDLIGGAGPSPNSPYHKNWSAYFETNANLTVTSNFGLGSADFCIEFFCRFMQTSVDGVNRRLISQTANLATGFQILIANVDTTIVNDTTAPGGLIFYTNTSVVGTIDPINDDQWHHVVFKRVSNSMKSYVDGIEKQSVLVTVDNFTDIGSIVVGAYAGNTAQGRYEGWLSNIRINTVDLPYPTDVTVPTTSLTAVTGTNMLLLHRAFWHPEGANLYTVANNGPAYMVVDGNGPFEEENYISQWGQFSTNSYLRTRNEASLWNDLALGDYTIEGWIWPQANSGARTQQTVLFGQGGYQMSWGFPGYWGGLAHFPSGGYTRTGIGYPQYNAWQHFVINRHSGNTTVRINGHFLGGTTTQNPAWGTYIAWGSNIVTSGHADWRIIRNESSFDNIAGNYELPTEPMSETFRNPSDTNNVIMLTGPNIQATKSRASFLNEGMAKHVGFNGYGSVRPTQINPFTFPLFYMLRLGGSGVASFSEVDAIRIDADQPFTWEMWVYLENVTNGGIMIHGTNRVAYNDDTAMVITYSSAVIRTGNAGTNSGTNYNLSYPDGVTLSTNQWNHIVLTRDENNDARLYLNGVAGESVSAPGYIRTNATRTDLTGGPGIFFGRNAYQNWSSGTDTFSTGYLCNVRFVKGRSLVPGAGSTPRYDQTNITPDTQFLAFTATSNSTSDLSNNISTINYGSGVSLLNVIQTDYPFIKSVTFNPIRNGGSIYLPGSSYIRALPYGFAIGLRDFSIECWFYSTELGNRNYWIFDDRAGVEGFYVALYVSSSSTSSQIRYYNNTGDRITGPTILINTWYHVAVTRISGVTRMFLNGVKVGVDYSNNNFYPMNTVRLVIGASNGTADPWVGFISNFRFCVGESVYPSTGFPLPTKAPDKTEKTQILLKFIESNVFDIVNDSVCQISFDSESVMKTYNDVAIKKYTGAISFNGVDDYIYVPHIPNMNKLLLNELKFTIELWFYISVSDIGSTRGLLAKGTATTGWSIEINNLGQLQFYYGSSVLTTPTACNGDEWNHIAVVREGVSGELTKLYLNGNFESAAIVNTNFNQIDTMRIGTNRTGANLFKGYIDSVRISKDLIRYTEPFLPPDKSFPER